jgi:putative transposase
MERALQHSDFLKLRFNVSQLCSTMEISRQAFYKRKKQIERGMILDELIIKEVLEIRRRTPKAGVRKLYHHLKHRDLPFKLKGRDQLFELLSRHNLLVKQKKRYTRTTNSKHYFRVYSNLIKELKVTRPGSILVSDITYIRTEEEFCYLFLITDLYSRKIVGHNLSRKMEAIDAVEAMKKALAYFSNSSNGMIHHSDRGIQYCSSEYVSLLNDNGILISMGEAGNPYENAVAERVNGILKQEFMLGTKFKSYQHAKLAVNEAIKTYNSFRPHLSLNYLTPDEKFAA